MLRKKTLQTIIGNTSLFALSSLLVYIAAEWIFFRCFTCFFPITDITTKFDNAYGVYPLLQSSKKHFYPKNYIAITGDSYAMGLGDDALAGDVHTLRTHTPHFIQNLTGRDVVTYGQPGSGSIRSNITNPITKEAYIRHVINSDYAVPEWMLIYFYEGNDLTENWIYYQETFLPFHKKLNYLDQNDFNTYIEKTALGKDHLYLSAINARFEDKLFLSRYVRRLFIQNIEKKRYYSRKFKKELKLDYAPDYKWVNRFSDHPVNVALINNEARPLADNMQGPSMDLSPEQLDLAAVTFSMALHYTKEKYPQTHLAVIYIPSVLETYKTIGDTVHVQNFFSDDEQIFTRQALDQRSNWTRKKIQAYTEEKGIIFIDTTNDLQDAAQLELLHGPKDLNHLNMKGYKILSQSIVNHMEPYWNEN